MGPVVTGATRRKVPVPWHREEGSRRTMTRIREQGVEDNHNYREGERIRRRKELMKKVLEKLVGRSEEPAGSVVENQIGEIGDEMVVEGQ